MDSVRIPYQVGLLSRVIVLPVHAIGDGTLGTPDQDKKHRRKRRTVTNIDFDDDDDEQQDESNSKQDDDDMDAVPTKVGRRAGKRKLKETNKKYSNEPVPAKLLKQMRTLLDFVIKYRDNDDNRVLSKPFMRLPTQKELPEYYETIKNPVDFNKIKKKLGENRYRSLNEIEADVMLLCKNAQEFNMENSTIYEDSIILQSVFTNARERMEKGEIPVSSNSEGESDDDEPLKKRVKKETNVKKKAQSRSSGNGSSTTSSRRKTRVMSDDEDTMMDETNQSSYGGVDEDDEEEETRGSNSRQK
ncbi:unnamed protein product [Rotaria magnacalcarata]|uniref:Bromo domain-containing protein n=1 Tax=Rotaria magnacalcarata TaxID=392030 RepID=A0A819CAA9_9BILA|nr:unnamed protein product [Rotaria magnacalcarata]